VGAQALAHLGAAFADVRQRVIQQLAEYRPGITAAMASPVEMRASRFRATTGLEPVAGGRKEARVVTCSFCGRRPPESGKMVMVRSAFICEHCVRDWSLQLGGGEERTHGSEARLYDPEQEEGGHEEPGAPKASLPPDIVGRRSAGAKGGVCTELRSECG
jgi:hypothetical protein